MKEIFCFLVVAFLITVPLKLIAQEAPFIRGSVLTEDGIPIASATINIRGRLSNSEMTTTSDSSGIFEFQNLDGGERYNLYFSHIAYGRDSIMNFVINENEINNVLIRLKQEKSIAMDEVVVVGYGTQKKADVTGSVSAVKGGEIVKAPVANVSNTLGGRISGVLVRQNSGKPGADGDQIRIRGISTTGNANPLIIMDGIPVSSLDRLNPQEIETITVLKDAAAVAPYGIGGANGVILVTTKRGRDGSFSLNYDAFQGYQKPTAIPRYLNAFDYTSKLNEANVNVGNPKPFADSIVEKYRTGIDPDRYPSTDWIGEILKGGTPISRHTLSFTGGSKKIRFFSSFSYLNQRGVVPTIKFQRYNISTNVDADITNTTTLSLDYNGVHSRSDNPAGISGEGIFTVLKENLPHWPIRYSNGNYANSLLPNIYESGYDLDKNNVMNIKGQITQQIPFIKGLAVKGVYALQKNYLTGKNWTLPVTFYSLNPQGQYIPQNTGLLKPSLSQSFEEGFSQTVQGFITYHRGFGLHDIDGLVVYENRLGDENSLDASRINYSIYLDELDMGSSDKTNFNNGGSSTKWAQEGVVTRLNYSYDGRYLLGISGRYDGHYYFAPGKRYVFFPAVSAGWNISREKFFENVSWVNALKLRASYGESGNLAGGPFQYLSAYGINNSYVFGGSVPVQMQGIYERDQANPNITWETAKKTNLGLDATILKRRIDFAFDYFIENRTGMLLNPQTTVPEEYGIGLSQINAGKMKNRGFELSLNSYNKIGSDFRIDVGFNFSHAKNTLIETFETQATFMNPNRRRTGRPLNTRFGLQADGFYQESDFNADGTLKSGLPVPSYGAVKPGDIKYVDIAGAPAADGSVTGPDGKININDETVIGKPPFPENIFGLNTLFSFRGLEFTAFFQGASGSSNYQEGDIAYPFFNGASIADYQTDYWTPNNINARYPRLTPSPTTNNSQMSSFWVINGAYLRLKTLELAYNLPYDLIRKAYFKKIRIALGGQNIFTKSAFKYIDPEVSQNRARYYFQQKTYSFTVNLGF